MPRVATVALQRRAIPCRAWLFRPSYQAGEQAAQARADVGACNYRTGMRNWTKFRGSRPYEDVNIVFARGTTLDALVDGLRTARREPLETGEAGGWAWAVHEMVVPPDFDWMDYRPLCPSGVELVVFVTEPCSVKAHAPSFDYYRDGRLVLGFSFDDLGQRVGDDPDYLAPEFLDSRLIGDEAYCPLEDEHDCWEVHDEDDEIRLVKTIADFFSLPSPPLSVEVAAVSAR